MKSTNHTSKLSIEEMAILSIDQLLRYAYEAEETLLAARSLKERINQAVALKMSA